jgi:hypothetical protein
MFMVQVKNEQMVNMSMKYKILINWMDFSYIFN